MATTAPVLVLTEVGLAAAANVAVNGVLVQLATFTIGSSFGYTPSPTDTGLLGTILYSGTITESTLNPDGSINVNCTIPALAGPFQFGEIAIYTSTGVLFAIATLPTPTTKYTSLVSGIAATFTFALVIKLGAGTAAMISVSDAMLRTLSSSICQIISQTGHGFAPGTVLYFNGTSWIKTNAGTLGGCQTALGVVSLVINADQFVLTTNGWANCFSGLTPNTIYYCSASTPGAVTSSKPSIAKPVMVATSSTTAIINIWPIEYIYVPPTPTPVPTGTPSPTPAPTPTPVPTGGG